MICLSALSSIRHIFGVFARLWSALIVCSPFEIFKMNNMSLETEEEGGKSQAAELASRALANLLPLHFESSKARPEFSGPGIKVFQLNFWICVFRFQIKREIYFQCSCYVSSIFLSNLHKIAAMWNHLVISTHYQDLFYDQSPLHICNILNVILLC